ncbi:hypothetical protein M3Y98_00120700 [Aphelenchoides besseyi]|nr:hypothetical protein M3Y98_00120700 [Aphelenchoides besseyi]KAI6199504.1 hypothetical protein M3Y96_00634300 [Aphelenchoides besseyi]
MKFVLSAVVFVVPVAVALGCSCGQLTQKQVFSQSDYVGRMRIVTKNVTGNVLTYTADYIEIYKPANQSHILIPVPVTTPADTATCGATGLKVGQDYLITGARNGSDIQINSCSGMPPKDGQASSPAGALSWKLVNGQLKKKLETGKF